MKLKLNIPDNLSQYYLQAYEFEMAITGQHELEVEPEQASAIKKSFFSLLHKLSTQEIEPKNVSTLLGGEEVKVSWGISPISHAFGLDGLIKDDGPLGWMEATIYMMDMNLLNSRGEIVGRCVLAIVNDSEVNGAIAYSESNNRIAAVQKPDSKIIDLTPETGGKFPLPIDQIIEILKLLQQ